MAAFDYVKPPSLENLINDYAQAKSEGAILAGGTDLLVQIRSGLVSRRILFDVSDLQEMKGLSDEGDSLRIGAATRISDIADSNAVQSGIPFLSLAASQLGSPQIRNRATVGGNILSASPAADTVPALMGAGAKLKLRSQESERDVSIADFMTGPGQTVIQNDEVLTEVVVPKLPSGCRSHFFKVGRRKAVAISIINLAGWLKMDKTDVIKDVRIILGAVGPTAIRVKKAEDFLKGKKPTQAILQETARITAEESRPISDIRGSEQGRRLLVKGWTFRLLQRLTN